MNSIPSARSRIQQQPGRVMDRQQQQSSGSGEFQPRQQGDAAKASQAGEPFYETRPERVRAQPLGIEQ